MGASMAFHLAERGENLKDENDYSFIWRNSKSAPI